MYASRICLWISCTDAGKIKPAAEKPDPLPPPQVDSAKGGVGVNLMTRSDRRKTTSVGPDSILRLPECLQFAYFYWQDFSPFIYFFFLWTRGYIRYAYQLSIYILIFKSLGTRERGCMKELREEEEEEAAAAAAAATRVAKIPRGARRRG